MRTFEVIVIGAGHAGCEAALASARLGKKTAVFTINLDNVASMPCNPSIGGPAKGHLVKEIDALGGEIGRNCDKTFVQMKMLNTKKGPAVRALRAQSDKALYHMEMKKTVENQPTLSLIQGLVIDIIVENGLVKGVKTKEGVIYAAKNVILATGTFMRGVMHVGNEKFEGGRMGEMPSNELPLALERLGIKLSRFRTGTPPRVNKNSVNFENMIEQPGDQELLKFSFRTKDEEIKDKKQLSCYLTYTNKVIHEEIKDNMNHAATYNGTIKVDGPRYCPSIETKIKRFEERDKHQVFLEPEGYNTNEIYVNGMTTSFPTSIQESMLKKISGLENAEIMRYGYYVEYDYIQPEEVKYSLESHKIEGLFFSGQINGTTGYEEAAGTGLMAGINSALKLDGKEPLILGRDSSYLGLMIDDLITKGTVEPYRVLTARAEHRLLLRNDNADVRLSKIGYEIGLLDKDIYERVEYKINKRMEMKKLLDKTFVSEKNEKVINFLKDRDEAPLKSGASLSSLLKRPGITYDDLKEIYSLPILDKDIEYHIETEVKYEGYISIQEDMINKQRKLEDKKIPDNFDFNQIQNLAKEAKERLSKVRPINIGQASRVAGVNPADISFLIIYLEKKEKESELNKGSAK